MIKWVKTGKEITKEGTTITYISNDVGVTIESRKRHIPHANGRPGTWDYTSYFVLVGGKEIAEKHSLRDAKEFVDRHFIPLVKI